MTQPPKPAVRMIVGLGNPGPEYARTHHNAGLLALTHLAPEAHYTRRSAYAYARIDGLLFVRPEVFMNESGQAVAEALSYFKIDPANLLVIHDESDLTLGTSKMTFGRGAAGHRGVLSIIEALGTKDFWRLRLGIRSRRGKAGSFVLAPLTDAQLEQLYSALGGTIVNVIEKLTPS